MSVRSQEAGYVALISVLIIGAAALAIGIALLTIGTDSQRTALIQQSSKQARALAVACTEEALQLIHDDSTFSGTSNLSLGQGTCTYTVKLVDNSTRSIGASGTVGDTTRKISVTATIGPSSVSVSSWQDMP